MCVTLCQVDKLLDKVRDFIDDIGLTEEGFRRLYTVNSKFDAEDHHKKLETYLKINDDTKAARITVSHCHCCTQTPSKNYCILNSLGWFHLCKSFLMNVSSLCVSSLDPLIYRLLLPKALGKAETRKYMRSLTDLMRITIWY